MWRRRYLSPLRRLFTRKSINRLTVNPRLIEANRLFENGEYLKAAELFEDLARKAEQRQIPQAPHLYLQAGASRIKANDKDRGIEMTKKGLGMLIERQKWGKIRIISEATKDRLKDNGLNETAKELQDWLDQQIPEEIKLLPIWKKAGMGLGKQMQLPTHCSSCGGPVGPKDIEWFGSNTAYCEYCGSPLKSE